MALHPDNLQAFKCTDSIARQDPSFGRLRLLGRCLHVFVTWIMVLLLLQAPLYDASPNMARRRKLPDLRSQVGCHP